MNMKINKNRKFLWNHDPYLYEPLWLIQGISASRSFISHRFASRGFSKGSDSIITMGSMETIKFSKWGINPKISMKSMTFCYLRVQDDCYNGHLLDFMGSKDICGFYETYGTSVSVCLDFTSQGYSFSQKIHGKRELPV